MSPAADLKLGKTFTSHRGRNDTYTENTFEGFRDALQYGLDGIEVDIRFSSDRVPFLYHSYRAVDTDEVFDFGDKPASYIRKRYYTKTSQNITELSKVLEHFVFNRQPFQTIAIDLKDYGYEADILDLLEKYDLFDKVSIFTWTPQVILRLHELLTERGRSVPLYFSYLRSDAMLRHIYPTLFGLISNIPYLTRKLRMMFFNESTYDLPLDEYATGYYHVYFSRKRLPPRMVRILHQHQGGICVNSRLRYDELVWAKMQGLKTVVFGGVYGLLRIRNINHHGHLLYNKYVDDVFLDRAHGVFTNRFYQRHFLVNVSRSWWFVKMLFANVSFFLTTRKLFYRDNYLRAAEYAAVKDLLQPGDIILLGYHKYLSGLLIRGPATHIGGYIGNGDVIHAVADGVGQVTLSELFDLYDTMVVLRPDYRDNQQEQVINHWTQSLAKPYDFIFANKNDSYYCSELIHNSLRHAGIDDGNPEIYNAKYLGVIHPSTFLDSGFERVFVSESLIQTKTGRIELNPQVYKRRWLRWYLNNW